MLKFALLLLIPLAAYGQVRCPDGSYRSSCPGGDGEEVGAPVSSYTAPNIPDSPSIRPQQQSRTTSPPQRQGMPPPSNRPRSVGDRARDMGLSRNELVQALNRGTLIRGMERADVDRIMGRPTDVDRARLNGLAVERLWYRTGGRWRLIIMRGGRLHSSNMNVTER